MEVVFKQSALDDLRKMDGSAKKFFLAHAGKLREIPPRRHMKYGLPYNVERVTDNARMAYEIESGTLYVVSCFATHKDYERWYRSFR